jgi:hypothetical protein
MSAPIEVLERRGPLARVRLGGVAVRDVRLLERGQIELPAAVEISPALMARVQAVIAEARQPEQEPRPEPERDPVLAWATQERDRYGAELEA